MNLKNALFLICINSVFSYVNRHLWIAKQKSIEFHDSLIRDSITHTNVHHGSPSASLLNPFPDLYLYQPLDHFDHLLKKTYKQRYWVNDEFFTNKTHGPVFLYIGGEAAESPLRVQGGEHYELARKYGALIFVVEHRFYGKSVPEERGLALENLRYLSSQQALADLASFHVFASKQYKLTTSNPWICFGGSYPGSLSAWFRIKYPQLVTGAISSSSPVHAIVNFEGYHDTTAAALADPIVGGSPKCAEKVEEAFTLLDHNIKTNKLSQIEKDFHSCQPLDSGAGDVGNFAGNLGGIFDGIIQYNNERSGATNVSVICKIMTNDKKSAYENLAEINKLAMGSEKCVDNSWKTFLNQLRNDTTSGNEGMPGLRQWIYQTCTQFGYYQTCDPTSKCIFSKYIKLQPNLDICQVVYGVSSKEVYDAVKFTNAYYGSDDPQGSRIVFVNGSIDPWHSLSVLRNLDNDESAIYINGTAHCANMHSSTSDDPINLVVARQKVDTHISKWLN